MQQRYKKEAQLQAIRQHFERIKHLASAICDNNEIFNEMVENDNFEIWKGIALQQESEIHFEKLKKIITQKIEPIWQKQPRCPRNKYKGKRFLLDNPLERQDIYNKSSKRIEDEVRNIHICVVYFLSNYTFVIQ